MQAPGVAVMVDYLIIETHRQLDESVVETYYLHARSLENALRLASSWVSTEGRSFSRRTARIDADPEFDENGVPDCEHKTVAFMDVEVE